MSNSTERDNSIETVNWSDDGLYEWNGEKIAVILQVEHPNLTFRFGVPRTHNKIDKAEAAFIQHYFKETGQMDTLYLDRSEIINYQLGLALIMNEVFREQDSVASKAVNELCKV